MAVVKLYDLARMTTATVGTGTITLGVAVSPYLSFSQAGVQNGDTVRYAIYDPVNGGSEIGSGVYTASGTTLTRSPTTSTANNGAINLSGQAQVFITASANDVQYNWVTTFGADPTGVNDSTAAIQAACNAGPGKVVLPSGRYLISSTITVPNGVFLEGVSNQASTLYFANSNITGLNFSGTYLGIRNIQVFGYNFSDATIPAVIFSGGAIYADDCVFNGGTYPVSITTGFDVRINRCIFQDGLSGNFYSSGSAYIDTCGFDRSFFAPTNLGSKTSVPAHANSTAYNQYDIVTIVIGGYTGVLQALNAGTTGTSLAPTKLQYGQSSVDGGVTWIFLGGYTSAVTIDAGSNVVFFNDCDFSGPFSQNVTVSATASGSFYFDNCDFGNALAGCASILGGADIKFTRCQFNTSYLENVSLLTFGSSFIAEATVSNNSFTGQGNGQTGISISAGYDVNIVGGNQFANLTNCVSVAANISGLTISNNQMGGIVGEQNVNGIVIASGTSDYFEAIGNTFKGLTGAPISWGGTGSHYLYEINGQIESGSSASFVGGINTSANYAVLGVAVLDKTNVFLNGASSGFTTLASQSVASGTITFPAATDTAALLTLAQTLTNKTLTSSTNVIGGVTMTLGSDATGDLYYRAAGGALTRLGVGSTGDFLTVAAGLPAWSTGVGISSVSNSDGTLTISPTTGAVVASLALGHANTWTGAQTFNAPVVHNPTTTIASGTSATLDDIGVTAATTTVTGTTAITTAKGFNKVSLYQPTITDSSAVTISKASTLYVDNAPLAAGSVTITQPWALNVGAGDVFIQGANETTTITDGTGVVRNAMVVLQRIVTGLSTTANGLYIDLQNNNATANQTFNGESILVSTPSGNSTAQTTMTALNGSVSYAGTGGLTTANGVVFAASNVGTGTVATANGASLGVRNNGGGTNSTSDSLKVIQPIGATTGLTSIWTNINGIEILDQNPSGAGTNTLTNPPVALLIDSQSASGAFAIKQSGSGLNSFASPVATPLVNLTVYTVSTLPSTGRVTGSVALVSDATSNIVIGVGGGSAYCLVAYNGSAWVAV